MTCKKELEQSYELPNFSCFCLLTHCSNFAHLKEVVTRVIMVCKIFHFLLCFVPHRLM